MGQCGQYHSYNWFTNWLNLQNNIFIWSPILFQKKEDCSLKYPHILGEFVGMKKTHDFMYGLKSQCSSIKEIFSKLGGCLHSRPKNKLKTFPPFRNEFLPPSKNITLKDYHMMYPMKQKYLCDYDHICIMSSGLIFDYIIMVIIRNNKLAHPTEKLLSFYTDWKLHHLYVQEVTSIFLLGKRNLWVSRNSMCTFPFFLNWYETLFDPHIKNWHFN